MAFYYFMLFFFMFGVIVGLALSCWWRAKCSRQRATQPSPAVEEQRQEIQPKAKPAPKAMVQPPVFDGALVDMPNPNPLMDYGDEGDDFDPPVPMPIVDDSDGDTSSSSSHHYLPCTTPGCSRPRNHPYRTCCRYCPITYSHSNECQERCGYPHINRLFPDAPQPPPNGQRPDIVVEYPQRVAVTRTGYRYHFNPNCTYFRQENGPGGRMLQPCQHCMRAAARNNALAQPNSD